MSNSLWPHGLQHARLLCSPLFPRVAQIHVHWVGEVKWSEVTQSCPTLCDPIDCSPPGSSIHGIFPARILEWVAIPFLVMLSNSHILCRLLLLLPSIFPSIRGFSNESVLRIRWPKYQSFSFSISSSNEYSGLISFKIDWFGLPAVQGTLKSLLQHHDLKFSIL